MAMKFRKKTLLFKLQAAVGTPETPTGALNAIQTRDLEIMPLEGEALSLELDKENLGADLGTLVGKHVKLSFRIPLAGSGDPTEAPAWGPVVVACGNLQTYDATPAAENYTYTPVDDAAVATIWMKQDKVLHKISDARGSMRIESGTRQYAWMIFEFIGIYQTPEASNSSLSPVLSAFIQPVPFRAASVTAEFGATELCIRSINFNFGQTNNFFETSCAETIELDDRKGQFEVKFVEPEIGTHNFFDDVDNDVEDELVYTHGTEAGNIIEVAAHHAQLQTIKRENDQGNMILALTGPIASVDGAEYTITAR